VFIRVHPWLIFMEAPIQSVERPILCNPYEEQREDLGGGAVGLRSSSVAA
jgi:hypothetical protein